MAPLNNRVREPYNYLITESEVVTGKSQTEASPYWTRYRSVNTVVASRSPVAIIIKKINKLITVTTASNNSFADNFTDEASTADMNGKIFVSHLLQLSLLSPALESFLKGLSNLYAIWTHENNG